MDNFYLDASAKFTISDLLYSSPYVSYLKQKGCSLQTFDCWKTHYGELLPIISEVLNSYFEVSYPVRYWSIRLYPWLPAILSCVIDKYFYVLHQRKTAEISFDIAKVSPFSLNISYSESIQEIAYCSKFNTSILHELLYFLDHKVTLKNCCLYLGGKNKSSVLVKGIYNIPFYLKKAFAIFSGLLDHIFSYKYQVYLNDFESYGRYPLTVRDFLFDTRYNFDAYKPIGKYIFLTHDAQRLATCIEQSIPNHRLSLVNRFILFKLPSLLPFEYYDKSLLPMSLGSRKSKRVFIATALWGCPYARAHFAQYVFAKFSRLCTVEHGGSIPVYFEQSQLETNLSDERVVPYTFSRGSTLTRVPILKKKIPKLIKFKSSCENKPLILLILPAYHSFRYRFSSQYTQPEALFIYLSLYNYQLNGSLAKRILLRFPQSPDMYNRRIRRFLSCKYRLSEAKSIGSDLHWCDISVIYYPETTVYDAVLSRKPFAIYCPASYIFLPLFDSLINLLMESGLLYRDLHALHGFLFSLDNVGLSSWWNSSRVQNVLLKLMNTCF
jgi:putative transferase (TIGR04331 family)